MVETFLKIPEKKKVDQVRSKQKWNIIHCIGEPDFYTAGYSGKNVREFINSLTKSNIATLIDIRFSPVSRYKPDFSKSNLIRYLAEQSINYIHRPDWGVPRDIRAFSIGKSNRDDIWEWYDLYVLPNVVTRNLDTFFNSMEHPVVFMCSELDPTECHRHRIFLALEKLGFIGCDL